MAKVENSDGPSGWLVDPHNKWAIHFDDKKKLNEDIKAGFNIDMWGIAPNGKPMKFKSRRKATKEDSIKTWKQLIASDWIEFDFQDVEYA